MTRRTRVRSLTIFLLAAVSLACSRDRSTVVVTAPFNDSTKIGELTAVWNDSGEERAFANAQRLDTPEVRFRFRVDARNRLDDGMFVRLGNFQLVDRSGLTIAASDQRAECILNAGTTEGVLSGEVWVPKTAVNDVAGFRVAQFGVPLSERGRSLYREWLLQERAHEPAQADAEIAGYLAAPACVANAAR